MVTCSWPCGCDREAVLYPMCNHHWFTLPIALRVPYYHSLVPGELPSQEHMVHLQAIMAWALKNPHARRIFHPVAEKHRFVRALRRRLEYLRDRLQRSDLSEGARGSMATEAGALQVAIDLLEATAEDVPAANSEATS